MWAEEGSRRRRAKSESESCRRTWAEGGATRRHLSFCVGRDGSRILRDGVCCAQTCYGGVSGFVWMGCSALVQCGRESFCVDRGDGMGQTQRAREGFAWS